jgi:hypothetical protein
MNNRFRTGVLLAALTALFMAVGYAIGGSGGMLMALAIAAATNLFAYWHADHVMLLARLFATHPATEERVCGPWGAQRTA